MSRTYYNIEKSRGVYVGWDSEGNRYRIVKNGPRRDRGPWWVYPQDKGGIPTFYAGSLEQGNDQLQTHCLCQTGNPTTS